MRGGEGRGRGPPTYIPCSSLSHDLVHLVRKLLQSPHFAIRSQRLDFAQSHTLSAGT